MKVSGTFSTDNATALRKAALGGHGIAYVPRCLVYHDFRNGELVDIFPELVGKKLGIYAVYPFTRQPPNKVRLKAPDNRILAPAQARLEMVDKKVVYMLHLYVFMLNIYRAV